MLISVHIEGLREKLRMSTNAILSDLFTRRIDEKKVKCSVCLELLPQEKMTSPSKCTLHIFCIDCWCSRIESDISNPMCIQNGCKNELSYEDVESMCMRCGRNDLFKRYDSKLTEDIINSMNDIIKCPKPGCDNRGTISQAQTQHGWVLCGKCRTRICTKCKKSEHRGKTCEEVERVSIDTNDSMTIEWIKNNTKSCPSCSTNIQKDDGCDHMVCMTCGYHFCYSCNETFSKTHMMDAHSGIPITYEHKDIYQIRKETIFKFNNFNSQWEYFLYKMAALVNNYIAAIRDKDVDISEAKKNAISTKIRHICSKRAEHCRKYDIGLYLNHFDTTKIENIKSFLLIYEGVILFELKAFICNVVISKKYFDSISSKIGDKEERTKVTELYDMFQKFVSIDTFVDITSNFLKNFKSNSIKLPITVSSLREYFMANLVTMIKLVDSMGIIWPEVDIVLNNSSKPTKTQITKKSAQAPVENQTSDDIIVIGSKKTLSSTRQNQFQKIDTSSIISNSMMKETQVNKKKCVIVLTY